MGAGHAQSRSFAGATFETVVGAHLGGERRLPKLEPGGRFQGYFAGTERDDALEFGSAGHCSLVDAC